MALAAAQSRVIISADTDFGALLSSSRAVSPSVILVRALITQRPAQLAATVAGHLDLMKDQLLSGAIAAFGKETLRVRTLRCAEQIQQFRATPTIVQFRCCRLSGRSDLRPCA